MVFDKFFEMAKQECLLEFERKFLICEIAEVIEELKFNYN
jgi:hypothetical protein